MNRGTEVASAPPQCASHECLRRWLTLSSGPNVDVRTPSPMASVHVGAGLCGKRSFVFSVPICLFVICLVFHSTSLRAEPRVEMHAVILPCPLANLSMHDSCAAMQARRPVCAPHHMHLYHRFYCSRSRQSMGSTANVFLHSDRVLELSPCVKWTQLPWSCVSLDLTSSIRGASSVIGHKYAEYQTRRWQFQ